jgi:hypothetical protein
MVLLIYYVTSKLGNTSVVFELGPYTKQKQFKAIIVRIGTIHRPSTSKAVSISPLISTSYHL